MKGMVWSFLFLILSLPVFGLEGVYLPRSIQIDGRLTEAVWDQAPLIDGFISPDKAAVEHRTEAKIVFTPQAIVFGFKSYIPDSELKIIPSGRDKFVSVDSVEIMLDTAGTGDNYKHIIVNAGNGLYDRYCEQGGFVGDEKWNGDITSAVHVDKTFWSCEISIPYYTLGLQANCGKVWKVNLCRESFGLASAGREISSVCEGVFNTASAFLPLPVPEQLDLNCFQLDQSPMSIRKTISDGKLELRLETDLKELGGTDRDLQTELLIPQPGSALLRGEDRVKLGSLKSTTVVFEDLRLNSPGVYQGIFTVREHASNRILLRRYFPIDGAYTPIRIKLISPHYRDSIFATQKLTQVHFQVFFELSEKDRQGLLTAGIRKDGKVLATQTVDLSGNECADFIFPVEGLPEGKLEIFAAFGKEETTHVLRKLPYKKGEVWRGTDGNWYRDGEKLFILSAWNATEYNKNYNIVTRNPKPDEDFLFYNIHPFLGLDKIQADINRGKITPEVEKFYQAAFDRYKDHPRLFGYFLCDEPGIKGFTSAGMRKVMEYLIDLDPWHPFMVAPGTEGVTEFADVAEISGFHCYPKVERHREMANFEKIVFSMDRARDYFKRNGVEPTITYLHQGFDYSTWGTGGTRIPSYEEFRNQDFLSLILGGRGLLHYNCGEETYPELYIGIPHLTKEQKIVGNEAIIEPDADEPAAVVQGPLRILAKKNRKSGELWVLVCNASHLSQDCAFRFLPFENRKIPVLSEARCVAAQNGLIQDRFGPFEVHIYTTDGRDFGLVPVGKIKEEIAAAYAERRALNAGNLFYQENENDTVSISASSNKFRTFRAEDSLWHLTDGLTGDPEHPAVHPDRKGIIVWQDRTPNQVPDSVTITTFEPVTIGRVEVYPAQNSLKDYVIELMVDGKFEVVAEVKDAQGPMQSVSFEPRRTTALRLTVNANRDAYTKVFEIKAFEK